MNSTFQLPSLSVGIPQTLIQSSGNDRAAQLARCLLDAGMIYGRVDPRRAKDPLGACRSFLEQWLRERLSGLKCLEPDFRLLLDGRSSVFEHSFDNKAREEPGPVSILWFAPCSAFAVGEALNRLEEIQTGLGAAVLSAIDRTSQDLVPAFTPRDALGIAQDFYWYGDKDETTALDEQCGDDSGQRATMRDEMVTREKIDAAYPKWATEWGRKRNAVSRHRLKQIAEMARSVRVRRVAQHALELDRLDLDPSFRPDADGWFVGYGAVLTWKTNDITVRVFDDYGNDAVQGDFCDWMGEFEFDIDKPQELRDWMDRMEVRLRGMRLLDDLIHELSTGDWRRVPKGLLQ